MSSTEDFFTSFSFEKEIERAEWFKNDLDQGGGRKYTVTGRFDTSSFGTN